MSRPLSTLGGAGRRAEITERTGLSFAGSRGPHLASIVEGMLEGEPGPEHDAPSRRPGGDATFDRLCDALTVQESFFFREPSRLALIGEHLLPGMRERQSRVRAWSAGCARGEEAYTLSMLLTDNGFSGRHQVLGTDLSPAAVAAARRGVYGRWAVRGLDEETVSSYFDRRPGGLQVAERFRAAVAFKQHNLLDAPPTGWAEFDLILCRNVLIYFTPEGVRRAAEMLAAALAPGGWLLLGVSDPPLGDVTGLQKVATPRGTAYRREDPTTVSDTVEDGLTVQAVETPVWQWVPRLAPDHAVPPPAPRPTAQELEPATPFATAESALAAGDARSAVDLARRALEATPHAPAAHLVMIQALADDGRTQDSLDASERAVDLFPENPRVRELWAFVLLEGGQMELAVVAARQAAYLDSGSALAQVVLARAHEMLGDAEAAQRARRNGQILGVGRARP